MSESQLYDLQRHIPKGPRVLLMLTAKEQKISSPVNIKD